MTEERRQELLEKRERLVNLLSDESWNDLLENNIIDVYNDTDSAGVSLYTLTDKFNKDYGIYFGDETHVSPEGYELVEKCGEYINNEFRKYFTSMTNSQDVRLNFKREKICDVGLWLKKQGDDSEAKKNYILHVLDDEGNKHPKFKYTGVKLARSVIPVKLRRAAKDVVEHLLLTQDRQSTDSEIQKLYDDFCAMPIEERAIIQRCNNIDKYVATAQNKDNWDECGLYTKGTPGHIRAAINFNSVIKQEKLKKYEPIRSGEFVKIVFVDKDNKYGIEKIGFVGDWPKEFDDIFTIDNKMLFEKIIYDEIKRVYKSVGWPTFNPAQNLGFNFFDFFNEEE